MQPRIQSYVRTERRGWALRQKDVAFLLGFKSRETISRLERSRRGTPLKTALALELIFGRPPKSMFPGFATKVEDAVMRRAYQMFQRIDGRVDAKALRQRNLLEEMLGRATAQNHRSEV